MILAVKAETPDSEKENSFLKDFIYLFVERGEGRERNTNVWLPLVHPLTGDLAHNPGMRPDWELNKFNWFTGRHSLHWATPARAEKENSWNGFATV